MNKRTRKIIVAVLLVLAAAMIAPIALAEGEDAAAPASRYYGTFLALLPPIVAITLALITKEVYSSLFVGIVVGAFLNANFKPVAAMDTLLNKGLIGSLADKWNAGIFLFLVILGTIVALINKAGGSAAFGRWARTHVRSRIGASIATFILGVLIFVDDYFNCLTVGSVMKPITDTHKISRAKLAYLIDATAAPVCMIAPISSWAAAVSDVASETGAGSGISLFCRAIPYNFYSLLTFVFIIGMILLKVDFGPMKRAELKARRDGILGGLPGSENDEAETESKPGIILDLLIPVIVLIVLCVIGMIYVGGFFSGETFIDAFSATDASVGLSWGSILALIITIIYLVARRAVTFKEAMECLPKGFTAMVPAILILTFALALKAMTGNLGADVFVFNAMQGVSDSLKNFLPAVIFLVACGLAFATGTSWGTFGILIPIIIPIFDTASPLFIIGISACLAGAVCGDHCSPISDTTIMASAGAQANHVEHVSTQLPYTLTVAGLSFVSYIIAGLTQSWVISLAVGAVLTVGLLVLIHFVQKKNENA